MPLYKKQRLLSLPNLLLWVAVAMVFPAGWNLVKPAELLKLAYLLTGCGFLGYMLLRGNRLLCHIPTAAFEGLMLFTGGTLLFLLLMIFKQSAAVHFFIACSCIYVLLTGKMTLQCSFRDLAVIVPPLLLLANAQEYGLAVSDRFNFTDGDFGFYEGITVSLRETLSLSDSVFHKGIGFHYQVLPMFFPAAVSKLTGVNAHVAYASVFVPFIKVCAYAFLSVSLVTALLHLYPAAARKYPAHFLYVLTAVCLLLVLPLNPLLLLRGSYSRLYAGGRMGYLHVYDSMGVAVCFLVSGYMLQYLTDTGRKTWREHLGLLAAMAALALSKIAFFYPAACFFFLSALSLGKVRTGIMIVCGALSGLLLLSFLSRNKEPVMHLSFTGDSSFIAEYIKLAGVYHLPQGVWTAVLLIALYSLMWCGIFLLYWVASPAIKAQDKNLLILPAAATCLVSLLPPMLLKMVYTEGTGTDPVDSSFDLLQITRSGFFMVRLSGIMALLFIISYGGRVWKYATAALTICWLAVSSAGVYHHLQEKPVIYGHSWEDEVLQDYRRLKPSLMAVQSVRQYTGQPLAASEIFPWWIYDRRSLYTDSAGRTYRSYLTTVRAAYRNRIMDALCDSTTPDAVADSLIRAMKSEGVDALVAHPYNYGRMRYLTGRTLLYKPRDSRWMFFIAHGPDSH